MPDLSPKKIQKVLVKIEEMADIFLNLANFASHAFLTLAPASGYALKLKALIKVSKEEEKKIIQYWFVLCRTRYYENSSMCYGKKNDAFKKVFLVGDGLPRAKQFDVQ